MVIPQLLVVVLLSINTAAQGNNTDLICHMCFDVTSPADCQEYVICGEDEMCFTREFTNHARQRGYHLGCESTRTCGIIQIAQTLFGKRSVGSKESRDTSLVPSTRDVHKCYRCCDKNFCNWNVCDTAGSTSVDGGCPPTFVRSPSRCYYVAQWKVTWDEARLDCQRRGADLVSINTAEEQAFVKNISSPESSYWTGGYYAPATNGWEWVDGTQANYTEWYPNYPQNNSEQYNERTGISSHGQDQWYNARKTELYSFICEMAHM
ncbi:C-type mannose receptor 2-like [Haliotis rufescens]|uniref:C-type mannose receptor 2-like n=1 Tax=Haliotis rufescens TaxID=6454 RepID=UPI00201E8B2E|nr:C-type mannose receptor 2-like [Haliotis rufescens]